MKGSSAALMAKSGDKAIPACPLKGFRTGSSETFISQIAMKALYGTVAYMFLPSLGQDDSRWSLRPRAAEDGSRGRSLCLQHAALHSFSLFDEISCRPRIDLDNAQIRTLPDVNHHVNLTKRRKRSCGQLPVLCRPTFEQGFRHGCSCPVIACFREINTTILAILSVHIVAKLRWEKRVLHTPGAG